MPKKKNPTSIEDYRPISVIGCLYKIVLKILANRLKLVTKEVTSDNQSGFIAGRQILNGILTANESVLWMKKKKNNGVVFKINFKKANDSINWLFLNIC